MPPKKRDKENDSTKNNKIENNNADHEQFLLAFEKPTQIYRYLRTRNMLRPIFLYRNLTYMKHRMSRTHKGRKDFKVDSMLQSATTRMNQQQLNCYLTLTFLGFYSKGGGSISLGGDEPVKVETLLVKICHKKRKEVACPVMSVSLGTSYVPFNPSEDCPPPKAPTVSIPTETFKLSAVGGAVKSYHLILRVTTSSSNIEFPTFKDEADHVIKKRKTSKADDNDPVHFGTNIVLYDKQNRCLLSDGEYEFFLDKLDDASSRLYQTTLSTWEDCGFNREFQERHKASFKKLNAGPTLKFKLQWTREQVTALVDRPKPFVPVEYNVIENTTEAKPSLKFGELTVVYQFLYNSNSKQQTEASCDMHCPWCSIDCKVLYSLLKHLKLSHPRFNFGYIAVQGGVRIDISVNDGYDGSSWTTTGGMTRGSGPMRRQPLSHIIVCRPKRTHNLSEFINPEETEAPRPYITGHNRLYHHTSTCLAIYPKEMDIDSEEETDPGWLQKKTMMMIDEFTDVNEGEKELMKMWNLHVMKHGFVGDVQVQLACEMFLKERGKELLSKNLYRNFVLHMCNLFDFGLVSAVTHFKIMQQAQEIIQTDKKVNQILQDRWTTQREHWNPVEQAPKPDESASPGGQGQAEQGQSRRKPTDEKGKRRRGRRLATVKPELRSSTSTEGKDTSSKKSAP